MKSGGFTRFVIVSEERTGSTLLQMLLDSHEQVICWGEVLNPSDDIRRNSVPGYVPILGVKDDAIEYLDSHLYGQVPDAVRAVGFRLMYSHARTGRWEEARRRIAEDDEIRIIHLTREDLLARYLSHRLAQRDGSWISTSQSAEAGGETIRLDIEDCVRSFTESELNQEEADRVFSAHPKYDLTFERITGDPDAESRNVLEFLGVEYQPLSSPTKRQQTRSKREVIENYEELRHFLTRGERSKPKWQGFIQEG